MWNGLYYPSKHGKYGWRQTDDLLSLKHSHMQHVLINICHIIYTNVLSFSSTTSKVNVKYLSIELKMPSYGPFTSLVVTSHSEISPGCVGRLTTYLQQQYLAVGVVCQRCLEEGQLSARNMRNYISPTCILDDWCCRLYWQIIWNVCVLDKLSNFQHQNNKCRHFCNILLN